MSRTILARNPGAPARLGRRVPFGGQALVLPALLAVYLFWGGTYLAMRIGTESLPPFLMAGSRFVVAGLVLCLYARGKGVSFPTLRQWGDSAVVGAMLFLLCNGGMSWASSRVPSYLSSLMAALMPVWMMVFLWMFGGRRPRAGMALGILLGFAGVAVLALSRGGGGQADPMGLVVLTIAPAMWALGSLYSIRASLPKSPAMASGAQMVMGGVMLLAVSATAGEYGAFNPATVTLRSWLGLAYLIVFGSIVAFSAYTYLISHAEPAWVSTYAFVNPIVAVFVGWLLAGERLTPAAMVASAIIVLSVVLVTVYRSRQSLGAHE